MTSETERTRASLAPPVHDADASDAMSLATERLDDGALLVRVGGDVDMLTAPRLYTAVEACLADGCRALVIDLRDVAFLASSGLAALVEARRAAERLATPLRLVATTRVVTRPLAATGLMDAFEVCDSLSKARMIA
jgi:anti-sigma B factor antagonist